MQGYFLCVQWILCENRLTQRRKGRRVCPYMRKVAHRNHRKPQNFAHSFLDRRTEEHIFIFTQRARSYMSFCSYVKNRCTQKAQKYTEFCSACLCESLRRLREAILLRKVLCLPCLLCETTSRRLRRTTQTLRNFAPLREKKISLSVKKLHTESTENHRILLRMLLRKSALSA